MKLRSIRHQDFSIYYKNQFEFDFLFEEIFNSNIYFFESRNEAPFVIDCGSHIGLSVLYFKLIYPECKILAFEPDPINFELLKMNVMKNGLENVHISNYALSDFEGVANFYGDFSKSSESVGNTMLFEWGDRMGFKKTRVRVARLSKSINQDVDFLKIDTEGTELKILKDVAHKLHLVNYLYVEFHHTHQWSKDLEKVKGILRKYDFNFTSDKLQIDNILNKKFPSWFEKYQPGVYTLNGKKNRYEA